VKRGRRLAAACGLGAALAAGGCTPPDRWEVFDTGTLYAAQPEGGDGAEGDAGAPGAAPRAPATDDQGRLVLSIEEAALLALENNRDLRVRRITPEIVATFEDIERGAYDPALFARAEVLEEEAVEISRATGENFATEREDTAYQAGVTQRLPTGTTVDLGVSSARSTSNRAPEQQDARVGLTITQALLRGRGARVNLASVRQARLDTVASEYELQAFVEALLAETERTYWLHALAVQEIRIFEESLEIARIQQRQVEDRIEIGVLAATERASAAAEVAQREQALIDARAELEVLRLRLLRLLNAGPGGTLDAGVVTTSEPRTDPSPLDDVAERVELAVRARPELAEARVLLEQARLETIVTRNGLLPRLDFFIALGKTGYADSFGRSFANLDADTYDLATGIDLSAPLGNRAARARDRAAIAGRRQAAESVANLEQLVRLEVRLAAAEVERARQQISASAATRSLREEALRAENERFEVGSSTSLLVAQAQRDLLESRIAEVGALVAYRLALVELYLAEGTLTQRRGVNLPG
jgi:outer membrane protein TolC